MSQFVGYLLKETTLGDDGVAVAAARAQARIDYNKGLGHEENPYPKGSVEYQAYMLEMGRLQNEEFNQECLNRAYRRQTW